METVVRVIYAAMVVGLGVLLSCSQASAQSGTRVGGFGRGGGLSNRSTYADRQRALEQQQAIARETARLRAQNSRQQYRQNLVQLAARKNSAANAAQRRLAFAEAKNDYQALRVGNVAANSLGPLNTPFRLTGKEIDRSKRKARWPSALRKQQFGIAVGTIDAAIRNNAIMTKEEAEQFLADLQTLNQSLNSVAASGRLGIKDYAVSRQFITGLANEVRASNLVN